MKVVNYYFTGNSTGRNFTFYYIVLHLKLYIYACKQLISNTYK